MAIAAAIPRDGNLCGLIWIGDIFFGLLVNFFWIVVNYFFWIGVIFFWIGAIFFGLWCLFLDWCYFFGLLLRILDCW